MPKLIKQTWFSSQAKRKGKKAMKEPVFPYNSIASLKNQPLKTNLKNYFCLSFSCLSKEFAAMSLSYVLAQLYGSTTKSL